MTEQVTWRELLWCAGVLIAGYSLFVSAPWVAVGCGVLMLPYWSENR